MDKYITTENIAIVGLLILAGMSLGLGHIDIALPIATAIAGYLKASS